MNFDNSHIQNPQSFFDACECKFQSKLEGIKLGMFCKIVAIFF